MESFKLIFRYKGLAVFSCVNDCIGIFFVIKRPKIFYINQYEMTFDSRINQIYQAKVETLRLLYFRLGYCGNDEEILALTSVAIGAAESLFN